MNDNYNNIAIFYDQLSAFIFGKAIFNAQRFMLQMVPPCSTVLLVGGGTGWILEELAKKYPSGLKITYIDSSSKMILLSGKRNVGKNKVIFMQADIRNAEL